MIHELWIFRITQFNQIGDIEMVCVAAIVHTSNRRSVLT